MHSRSRMLRTQRFPLTGCSSDWQSAAFGTQKSLVQIQSPRLSFPWRRLWLAFVGGVVAAAFGGGASPSQAEHVTPRSGEIVAREAPGTGQAGIAVLRGSDRVQLVGERDDWSEILLSDGRRAWVPTAEIARGDPPHPIESPVSTVSAPATTAALSGPDHTADELRAEIARLRAVVDDLTSWRARLPETVESTLPLRGDIPWAIAGAALIIGLLLGGAWERRRSRRDRSLRF